MIKVDKTHYFDYAMIGEFHSDGNWIHPARVIDSYELILVLEGIVHIKEDDTVYTLRPNECLILEPGRPHTGTKISDIPTAFYWFHFTTNLPIPFKENQSGSLYNVKYLLKKLLHMSKTPSYPASAGDAAGLMIFYELGNVELSGNSLANKIAEYIRVHKTTSVTKIAQQFGYNPDYIGKLFKKHFGSSIKQYINLQRMNYAKDLLLTTDLSVKEIAAQMEFAEENLFIKYFIYHEEISPVKFRNKYFNTHMNNK